MNAKRIAMFVDVDNCALEYIHYENVLSQVKAEGDILYGKLYGVSDKKHKEIIADAEVNGFETCHAMRIKKRGAKVYDNRITLDVVNTVFTTEVDAVAIVCAPADMVYLYSFLRKNGIEILACDNGDEPSMGFVDTVIDLGKVEEIKLPKAKKVKAEPKATPIAETPVAEKTEEQPQTVNSIVDEAQQLLRQIEELRREEQLAEKSEVHEKQPIEQKAEEIFAEAQPEAEPIVELTETAEPVEEQPIDQPEEVTEQPAEMPAETTETAETTKQPAEETQQPAPQPQTVDDQESDDDLIRKIADLRSQTNDDDSELVDKIKRILDGVDD